MGLRASVSDCPVAFQEKDLFAKEIGGIVMAYQMNSFFPGGESANRAPGKDKARLLVRAGDPQHSTT